MGWRNYLSAATILASGLAAWNGALANEPHVAPMQAFAQETVQSWISEDLLIQALRDQNAKHAGLTQAEIDAMDQQWRAETGAASRPLIEAVLSSALSGYLSDAKAAAGGLVTEIFVMDSRGLNVGQSDVTSDYWQGDEAKWQKTYGAGPDTLFIDEVEQDESTQTFQSQLSMSIKDPATGEVIGAITVGMNVDAIL